MQQTHTHKAVAERVKVKMLLSRRRQSEAAFPCHAPINIRGTWCLVCLSFLARLLGAGTKELVDTKVTT